MKFLADVNIPLPLIKLLKKMGHDVQDARVNYPSAKDSELIKIAQDEGRIILTRDKDFLELRRYPQFKTPLIFIRLQNQSTENIVEHIKALLSQQNEEIITSSVTVIEEGSSDSYS